MKKLFIIGSLLLATSGAIAYTSITYYGKCSAGKNCSACTNCKYCKHCAKDGGSCGVCN